MRETIITIGEYVNYHQPELKIKIEPKKPVLNLPSSFKFWKRLMETPYYKEEKGNGNTNRT